MALHLDPDVLRAEVDAAWTEAQRGRPVAAVERYRDLHERIVAHADADADAHPALAVQRARVLLGLAAAEFEVSGRLEESLGLLDQAETVAERAGAPAVVVTVRGQRGLLLLRSGRHDDAMRALDGAAALREQADHFDRSTILLNRGVLHLDTGSLSQAAADFEECVEMALATGDQVLLNKARHNLGYADFLAGRIPRALAAMEAAEQALAGQVQPIGLLDRARVLRAAGLHQDAQRILTTVSQAFVEAGLHHDAGETDLDAAECHLVEGDVEGALALARRAEQLFARRGNLRWRRTAQLLVLRCERRAIDQVDAAARRRLRRLATRAQDLADAFRSEGRHEPARSAELLALECALRARPPARARAKGTGEQLRVRVRSGDPLPVRLQAREVRALAALDRGDRTVAAQEVRKGLAELGSYQNRFGSLDLRTASAVHGVPLARLGLDLALETGRPEAFFAAVERGRALSTRLARVGPPDDARTAELLGRLRQTEERLRGLDPSAAAETARLRRQVARLQRDIRARSWELEGGRTSGTATARLSEVGSACRERGTTFVTFVVHQGRWRAVVIGPRGSRLVELAPVGAVDELVQRVRADLDALALPHLPPPLLRTVRGSLDAGLARLDRLLLAPLGVDGESLVVSATAALVLVPWSLLPSRRGLPVVVTPSATAWLRHARTPRGGAPRVVSLAGPGLLRAEEETRQVADLWPAATSYVGEAASTAVLRDALAHADVVHVAAHGTHQQESPLFSSLRVADGPVYAYELDAASPHQEANEIQGPDGADGADGVGGTAPCVVLSACEAGLATVRPGDEGLGLTSVLLHLGSQSVLAGVARVRDDVAARVMQQTHRAMAAGADSATALAGALASEEEPAPFVTFGATW